MSSIYGETDVFAKVYSRNILLKHKFYYINKMALFSVCVRAKVGNWVNLVHFPLPEALVNAHRITIVQVLS